MSGDMGAGVEAVVTFWRVPNPWGETARVGRHRLSEKATPRYAVALNGDLIGNAFKAKVTREQRTLGRTYVNSRWSAVAWRAESVDKRTDGWHGGHRIEYLTRVYAIQSLLESAGMDFGDAHAAAKTAQPTQPPAAVGADL